MKSFPNSNKLKASIASNMIYIITFLDNSIKYTIYTGGNMNGIYSYLYIIGSPTALTTSVQIYHHFFPSYSINNDTAFIQPVISALLVLRNNICDCCGIIGHKAYDCIILVP